MVIAGGYPGKKSARGFVERRWNSNDGWMARTGCVSAAAISPCTRARTRCDRQVLPAYGLQDLPIKGRNLPRQSNPNTMCLLITLGENLGGGHFYLAQIRTFLLCVDTDLLILSPQNENVRIVQSRNVRFHGWPGGPWRRSEWP